MIRFDLAQDDSHAWRVGENDLGAGRVHSRGSAKRYQARQA